MRDKIKEINKRKKVLGGISWGGAVMSYEL